MANATFLYLRLEFKTSGIFLIRYLHVQDTVEQIKVDVPVNLMIPIIYLCRLPPNSWSRIEYLFIQTVQGINLSVI